MQEKCLKMLSLTSQLLLYTCDCLIISLIISYNLPENGHIFCHRLLARYFSPCGGLLVRFSTYGGGGGGPFQYVMTFLLPLFCYVFRSFFFSKKLPIVVVRDVCPSVRLLSVEIISFRGNLLSNRPIDLKIGLNVREGVVHAQKA